MKVKSGYKNVRCSKCNRTHTIDISKVDIGENYSEERPMGQENAYSGIWNDQCTCGNSMEAEIEIYEYPAGTCELVQIVNHKG
jgi:hypothetical protein